MPRVGRVVEVVVREEHVLAALGKLGHGASLRERIMAKNL
jgi:hypothetical protein